MKIGTVHACCALLACFLTVADHATAEGEIRKPPLPTAAALKLATSLQSSRMGVDRFGNLWAWNRQTGSLKVLSPAGTVAVSTSLPAAIAVDYDAEWGAVWITDSGREVVIRPTDGAGDPIVVSLPNRVAEIALISGGRIAVSPVKAGHRVEIWDPATKSLVATWGTAEELPQRPGVAVLHAFLLRFDSRRDTLYSLDAFSGEIEAFDPSGKVVASAQLTPHDDPELRAWLENMDKASRDNGETKEIFLREWPDFFIDNQGVVWVAENCREHPDVARFDLEMLGIAAAGEPRPLVVANLGCCSGSSVIWGSSLLVYREPDHPSGACIEARSLENPELKEID